jgi:hypothetical protein
LALFRCAEIHFLEEVGLAQFIVFLDLQAAPSAAFRALRSPPGRNVEAAAGAKLRSVIGVSSDCDSFISIRA